MLKKALLINIFTFVVLLKGFAQNNITKSLYFYQDSVSFLGCGVIRSIDILYFVSDTSTSKKVGDEYYIAVACAETYGEGFFKKGRIYELQLNQNFRNIKPYIPPSTLKHFMRQKNFYVAQKIK